jgi:hypothetical protein
MKIIGFLVVAACAGPAHPIAAPPHAVPDAAPATPDAAPAHLTCAPANGDVRLASSAGGKLGYCVIAEGGAAGCFETDLATEKSAPGAYLPELDATDAPPRPRRPRTDVFTAKADGEHVALCPPGALCAETKVKVPPTEPDSAPPSVAVSDDGALFAIVSGSHVSIYKAASDHPTAFKASPAIDVELMGHTLAVTSTPCAGPCSTTQLRDEKGNKLADVGGKDPANTSSGEDARVGGDVWAWDDGGKALLFQDVRTGKVIAHIDDKSIGVEPSEIGESPLVLVATDLGLAAITTGANPGDVVILGANGKQVKKISAPRCKP